MKFATMLGLVLKEIYYKSEHDRVYFKTECGRTFLLYHVKDCCETVTLEDVCGDFKDLIGNPLLECEEASSEELSTIMGFIKCPNESCTWTFYKLGTIKGRVTMRWMGSSNGYYSESVDFKELTEELNHARRGN